MNNLTYLKSALSRVNSAWLSVLTEEQLKPIDDILCQAEAAGQIIYPPKEMIFSALRFFAPKDTRVVILGQDPYHGPNQAMGMSFSVQKGVRIPPSLRNIYKELHNDLGNPIPKEGDLTAWAEEGVLLLNSVLTVQAGKAGSHDKIGWQVITDALIELVNQHCDHCVFMLWGNWAIKKASLIDEDRHLILTTTHPSPLSANRGFLGCRHFSKANAWLAQHGKPELSWLV